MNDLEMQKVLLKPILLLKDSRSGGDGISNQRPKKNVSFKRVVEYYTYSDDLKMRLEKTSLLPDENLQLSGVDIPKRHLSEPDL